MGDINGLVNKALGIPDHGASLDGLSFRLSHADCCGGPGFATPDGVIGGTPETEFELDTADIVFDKFDLESHVLSLYATYGITDRWDVNVLLPIIFTSLDVSAHAVLNNFAINPGDGLPVHLLPDGTNVQTRTVDDDATGVGDLLLRTKYHFLSSNGFNQARTALDG